MVTYIGFLDDSGSPVPDDRTEFFSLGLVCVPVDSARTASEAWWQVLADARGYSDPEKSIGLELKSSDTYQLLAALQQNRQSHVAGSPLNGLPEPEVTEVIDAIWRLLATGTYRSQSWEPTYLGICIHKEANWTRFRAGELRAYRRALQSGDKRLRKQLAQTLAHHLQQNALTFLLQRLQYLMKDPDHDGQCILIGDENAYERQLYEIHASLASGEAQFTRGERLVNNIVFGSSRFNPILQMADWVAFAVTGWARSNRWLSARLADLLPKFRGAPDQILGRGLVLSPDHFAWPQLP